MSATGMWQEPGVRVAFQGERGAYGDLAIERVWGRSARRVPQRDFRDVVHAVSTGAANYGVLPVHNTISGPVPRVREVLASSTLVVNGEVEVPVRHCLLGVAGSSSSWIRRVLSHPVALGQCTRFIAERRVLAIPHYDTAGAARAVAERASPSAGAIASEDCARRYGLRVLARHVSDHAGNVTRFVVITRR